MSGPRATAVFLLLSSLIFAGLLLALSWRAAASGLAAWLMALAAIIAAGIIVAAVIFSRGAGEGRL